MQKSCIWLNQKEWGGGGGRGEKKEQPSLFELLKLLVKVIFCGPLNA